MGKRKLTKLQNDILEEIAYDFIYRVARGSSGRKHGYIKRAPDSDAWEKASITVKALVAFPSPLLAELPTEGGRMYLTTAGWMQFLDQYPPDGLEIYPPAGSKARRLTDLADQRVEYIASMLASEDGDDMSVAGEYSHRTVNVR